ncbi:MAG TPA: helix-turn-helix domain-containing protein [Halothiobacillus sp.]|nr:helix-turn-helix domain-containing protein [Halothiobacillus sp.]HQS28982.1 helix-turn-helix domain-containing protein [Halothiobacillus sp.]
MFLLQNIGVLLTRERLNQIIFGLNPDIQTRALDVHISTLRRALDLRPENGWRLATVYGRGYRLERSETPTE